MSGDKNTSESAARATVAPADRQEMQKWFEWGQRATATQPVDYDQAHEYFSRAVLADPGNLLYVQAMLENLIEKHKNKAKGSILNVFSGKGQFKKAVTRRDWEQVFRFGPEVLKSNPQDVPTLLGLAEACLAQEDVTFQDTGIVYLQAAAVADSKNAEVHRRLGRALNQRGRFEEAMKHWQLLMQNVKDDKEGREAIQLLATKVDLAPTEEEEDEEKKKAAEAEKVKEDERLEQQVNMLIRRPKSGVSPDEDGGEEKPKRREIQLTPRQRLEQAISNDPTEISNYLELAAVLADDERYGHAKTTLQKALNISPGDLQIREFLDDIELRQIKNRLAMAEMQAAQLETPKSRELVDELRKELHRVELEQFAVKCDRYPEDLDLKYEFGLKLKRMGNFSEAMKMLQEATFDPNHRAAAMVAAGECCQQLRQYKKALKNYMNGVNEAKQRDMNDIQMLGLYRAGILAAALKQTDLALKCLKRLHGMDSKYKDVAARLDKLNKIQDKE